VAPDLFRCVVGYAGVYDLEKLPEADRWVTSQLSRAYFRRAVGSDPAALRAASPAHQAARLSAAVLLVHGEEDDRAPLAQAERMRDALVAAGRPPEWLVERREGHGFYGEEARVRLYRRLLAFLRAHTAAGPSGPAPAAP
jgi:dipeptidyl aminopeptidase/acylaminoacyl peptidase